uniref:Reverse transcriptase domain-containing protein n=1 Tax=Haemonchus contortus TaxID=6289 RepID=A0A7I4XWV1_HAECO
MDHPEGKRAQPERAAVTTLHQPAWPDGVDRSFVERATLENIMRRLKWEDLGAKVDGHYSPHLHYVDDIVPATPNIEQAERTLSEFGNACGNCRLLVGRKVNVMKDLAPKLSRSKRIAWETFKNIERVVKKTKNCAHLFDTAVLPALTYTLQIWDLRKQDEHAVSVIQRALGRRSSDFQYTRKWRRESRVPSSDIERKSRYVIVYAKKSMIR